MIKMRNKLIILIILLPVISVLSVMFFLYPQSHSGKVNDFRLETLKHGRFYLNQEKGKIVVLIFWSTWCKICKKEMVDLKTLFNEYNKSDIVFGAVCTDPENMGSVLQIVKTLDIDYLVMLDNKRKLFRQLKLENLPSTVVFDRSGKIVFTKEGYNNVIYQQVKRKIDSLMISEKDVK